MKHHKIFFSLLLILLPTQLGFHFWPDWSMVLGRRVDYLAPTVYVTDVLILLTLLFWFIESRRSIRVYVLRIMVKRDISLNLFPLIRNTSTIILFLLFVGINILAAHNHPVAIYKWVKIGEFILFGWYIVKTKPSFSTVVTPLSVGVLYSSVLAIAQFVLQHSIGGPLWWFGERTFTADTPGIARVNFCQLSIVNCQLLLRPYATFPHPNVLGGYIAALLPLVIATLLHCYVAKKSYGERIFSLATSILGIFALAFSFSRSAWTVGAGVSILYYVLWLKVKRSYSLLSIIRNTIPIILLVLVLLRIFPLVGESVVVRSQLNNAAIELWKQSPLVGIGLGNFLVKLPDVLPSRSIYFLQPVHNIYLLVLAETGAIGLLLFVLFLWNLFKKMIRAMKHVTRDYKRNSLLLVTCYLSLVALLILGLVDHYPFTLQQGQLLFTLALGLSLSLNDRVRKN